MSATIPETALMSDLLKPTGFNCPAKLQGKTFAESTAGDTPAALEDNKEVSLTENGTIEITPTAGHDYAGMKKVTANVNVAGGADIEANKAATIDVSTYTEPVEITPTAGKDGMAKVTASLVNIPSGGYNFKDAYSFKVFGFAEDERHSGYPFLLIDANGFAIDDIADATSAVTALIFADSMSVDSFTVTAGVIEGYPIRYENADDTVANLVALVGYKRYY